MKKQQYLEVFFDEPYYTDGRWRAYVSDTNNKDRWPMKYSAKILLPDRFTEELEATHAEVIK